MVERDTAEFVTMVRNEVVAVSRTPLRLGSPDSLHSNSTILLRFAYDRTQEQLSRRFILVDGRVSLTADLVRDLTTESEAKLGERGSLRVHAQTQKNHPGMPPSHLTVLTIYDIHFLPDPLHQPSKHENTLNPHVDYVNPRQWSRYIPLEERKPLKDWVGYLKGVLSGDLPRKVGNNFFDEMVESEGRLVAEVALAKMIVNEMK
ncbi:hypothetical protein P7C70_g52, partial [Phenoliferia sp. Uapishka_3]